MRTLNLTEHEATPARLTQHELDQVLATGIVNVTPRLDGDYELRPESVVGTVVRPRLRLLITPKIGIRNLFFLLSYANGLTSWDDERFPYEEDDDLFGAVAWLFESEVRRASRYGLTRGYRERDETLSTIRGRIDIGAQLRARQGRRFPLECRYQDYTEDSDLNRVLKAAHRRLLRLPRLERELGRRIHRHMRLFNEVEEIDYPPMGVPKLGFNRLNDLWEPPAVLADLILRQDSVRDRTGSALGMSFTVDMNKVFERFVEVVVREEARRHGYVLQPQAPRRLTRSVRMRPDLVIKAAGHDVAVADAKYKELHPADWPHADLYQMLAYCVALRVPRGLLIYAGSRRPRYELVEGNGVTLEIIGIDLGGDFRAALSRTRAAAARVIYQANLQACILGSNAT